MNAKQKKVILIGVVIILLMFLIPPWTCTFSAHRLARIERPGSYGFLFYPPSPESVANSPEFKNKIMQNASYWSIRLDTGRLLVQCIGVALSIFVIIMLLKEKE